MTSTETGERPLTTAEKARLLDCSGRRVLLLEAVALASRDVLARTDETHAYIRDAAPDVSGENQWRAHVEQLEQLGEARQSAADVLRVTIKALEAYEHSPDRAGYGMPLWSSEVRALIADPAISDEEVACILGLPDVPPV